MIAESTWKKTASVLAVLTILTAGLAVCAVTAQDDADDADATLMYTDGEYTPTGFGFLVIGAVFLAGMAVGYMLPHSSSDTSGGSADAVHDFSTEMAMYYTALDSKISANTSSMLLDNISRTWQYTYNYFDRAAEISAGQNWSSDTTFDAKAPIIMKGSGNYEVISDSFVNNSEALAYMVDGLFDRIDMWSTSTNTDDDNIKESLVWNGGQTTASNTLVNGHSTFIRFETYIDTRNNDGLVYFPGADYGTDNTDFVIYALDDNSEHTISSDNGTNLKFGKTLDADKVKELTAGYYTLSSGRYIGMFLPSFSGTTGHAVVTPCIHITTPNGEGYAVSDSTDSAKAIVYYKDTAGNGSLTDGTTTSYIQYMYSADGVDKSYYTGGTTERGVISNSSNGDTIVYLLSMWSKNYNASVSTITHSQQMARIAWNVMSTAGSANLQISPSAVLDNISKVNGAEMSTAEATAIYTAALSDLTKWSDKNADELNPATILKTMPISESISMTVLGTIRDNSGATVESNVVFTPLFYDSNQEVLGSGSTVYQKDGMAIVWDIAAGTTITQLADFDASADYVTGYHIINMRQGASFDATQVYVGGNAVSSTGSVIAYQKTLGEIANFTASDDNGGDSPVAPKVIDTTVYAMIIFAELGAILAILGMWGRQPFFVLIGFAVALLGYIFSGDIASWMVEQFGK